MIKYFYYLLILCLCFPEEELPYDPEEFSETSQYYESTDIYENEYSSRIRFTPHSSSKGWHLLQLFQHEYSKLGLRIDENISKNKFDLSRFFLSKYSSKYSIIIGSIKVETGLGLVFSNEFGKFKSCYSVSSLNKDYDVLNGSLNSNMPSSISGVSFQFNYKKLKHSLLFAQGYRSITSTENGTIFHLSFAGSKNNTQKRNVYSYHLKRVFRLGNIGFLFAKEFINNNDHHQNYYSLIFSKQIDVMSFSSEIASRENSVAHIINFGLKQENFQWFIQKRYIPLNWSNIVGYPFSEFHDGCNEDALLLYIMLKENRITVNAMIDLFSKIKGEDGYPKNLGFDHRIMASYYNNYAKLEFRYKEKSKYYHQQNIEFGLSNSYWSLLKKKIYEVIIKFPKNNSFTLRYKYLKYLPEIEKKEEGSLITIYFPKLFVKKWRIISCLRWFSTDSWNSRLYAYDPGLKGEFPIKGYYGKGWQCFLKCEYGLSTQTDVSFRGSCEWKNNPLITFAIQMDVTL